MFRAAKATKPRTNSKIFLKIEVLAKNAKKVANIVKATKEYIPEQATSTVKFTGCPAAVDRKRAGAPYKEDNSRGNPTVFNKL